MLLTYSYHEELGGAIKWTGEREKRRKEKLMHEKPIS